MSARQRAIEYDNVVDNVISEGLPTVKPPDRYLTEPGTGTLRPISVDNERCDSRRLPPRTRRCLQRHGARRWQLAAGVTAGLLLAGCGGGSTPGRPVGGHVPVPPGAPAGGQVITTKGYNGPVLVSSDGRTLTVGGGGLSRPCFGTLNPVAIAERTVVALWLRYVTPSQHGVCRSDMALYPPTNVRLSTPVGGRELVNGATGHPLSWFSLRELLRPSAIPAGLKPGPVIPGAPVDGAASMASGFTRSYQSASYSLDIVESSVPLRLPEVNRAPGPIEVRGLPGQGTVGDTVASGIMWHEAGIYIEILAEYSAASGSPLSVPQLITIADSAPPLPPVRQG